MSFAASRSWALSDFWYKTLMHKTVRFPNETELLLETINTYLKGRGAVGRTVYYLKILIN